MIDPATDTMYVVAFSTQDDQHYLHALDLSDGLRESVPPVRISAAGFDPLHQRNRPGLLLMNGVVYVAFGTFICDHPQPYSGWVFGYRKQDLSLSGIFRTPAGLNGAGIWQSGRGVVGSAKNLYLITGNDNYPPTPAPNTLANSFVKLEAACHGPGLRVVGSFTPDNTVLLSLGDTDLWFERTVIVAGRSPNWRRQTGDGFMSWTHQS